MSVENPVFNLAHVGGFTFENGVYLPEQKPISNYAHLFHEAGHIFSEHMSFRKGQVLSPDEAKEASINIPIAKRVLLTIKFTSGKVSRLNKEELDFANSIMKLYTKGNYDLNSITVNQSEQAQFISLLQQSLQDPETGSKNDLETDLEKYLSNSAEGRNRELGAYATEFGCMCILLNSIKIPVVKVGIVYGETIGSHARAHKIVRRAYDRNGCIIPSMLDLDEG